jgi:hypothetical protein
MAAAGGSSGVSIPPVVVASDHRQPQCLQRQPAGGEGGQLSSSSAVLLRCSHEECARFNNATVWTAVHGDDIGDSEDWTDASDDNEVWSSSSSSSSSDDGGSDNNDDEMREAADVEVAPPSCAAVIKTGIFGAAASSSDACGAGPSAYRAGRVHSLALRRLSRLAINQSEYRDRDAERTSSDSSVVVRDAQGENNVVDSDIFSIAPLGSRKRRRAGP